MLTKYSRMVHFARTAEQLAAEVAAIERAAEEEDERSVVSLGGHREIRPGFWRVSSKASLPAPARSLG